LATLISHGAGNWVDRGEPPGPTLRRILGHCFGRDAAEDAAWLEEHARAVLGMVEADASEVHVAGYLRSVARGLGLPAGKPAGARVFAIGLWHAAKAAQVRDRAERALRGGPAGPAPGGEPLGHWLAARLLSPEELAAYEREGRAADAAGTEP